MLHIRGPAWADWVRLEQEGALCGIQGGEGGRAWRACGWGLRSGASFLLIVSHFSSLLYGVGPTTQRRQGLNKFEFVGQGVIWRCYGRARAGFYEGSQTSSCGSWGIHIRIITSSTIRGGGMVLGRRVDVPHTGTTVLVSTIWSKTRQVRIIII